MFICLFNLMGSHRCHLLFANFHAKFVCKAFFLLAILCVIWFWLYIRLVTGVILLFPSKNLGFLYVSESLKSSPMLPVMAVLLLLFSKKEQEKDEKKLVINKFYVI